MKEFTHAAGAVSTGEVERSSAKGRAERVAQLKAMAAYYTQVGDLETAKQYQSDAAQLESA